MNIPVSQTGAEGGGAKERLEDESGKQGRNTSEEMDQVEFAKETFKQQRVHEGTKCGRSSMMPLT